MPRATVTTDTVRHELKSLPEGYVVLRPMPYGVKLTRSQEAMKMTIKSESGPRKRGQAQTSDTEVTMLQMAATLIDFRSCVVDHNLTKDGPNGEEVKMDLGNQKDFESLDPRIGEEISALIDEMNNFEAGEEGKLRNAIEVVVVLDGGTDSAEIQAVVEMTTLCRILNVLPYAGGLYEQPWIVVEMMKMVIEAQHKKDERKAKRNGP